MTDWLARKVRGVIDFRLPGEPPHLPDKVSYARIVEYYEQIRRHGEPGPNYPREPVAPARQPGPPEPPEGPQPPAKAKPAQSTLL